eukprot:CAMPEP_0115876908 /NCGR_PEP_ID=MMETSP0287-20121206/25930_1 /TAXON_ID=412157 /ORGANISM="Chrysochromulina rotalis, Strain UIO044" /LENGTH=103 /DNA_ID=CAMNT_0003332367 /DNA_START=65 /DNA_END=373 /DNA_ORIENTATION=+
MRTNSPELAKLEGGTPLSPESPELSLTGGVLFTRSVSVPLNRRDDRQADHHLRRPAERFAARAATLACRLARARHQRLQLMQRLPLLSKLRAQHATQFRGARM